MSTPRAPRGKAVAAKAVKYGPHLLAAARLARGPAEKMARDAMERRRSRRDALAHAEGVTGGTVLQQSWQGHRVWVVWSGDEPVACYPDRVGDPARVVPMDDLVRHADLGKRRTPEQVRDQSALGRARRSAAERIGRRGAHGPATDDAAPPPGPRSLP